MLLSEFERELGSPYLPGVTVSAPLRDARSDLVAASPVAIDMALPGTPIGLSQAIKIDYLGAWVRPQNPAQPFQIASVSLNLVDGSDQCLVAMSQPTVTTAGGASNDGVTVVFLPLYSLLLGGDIFTWARARSVVIFPGGWKLRLGINYSGAAAGLTVDFFESHRIVSGIQEG